MPLRLDIFLSVILLRHIVLNGVKQDDVLCRDIGHRLNLEAVDVLAALLHDDRVVSRAAAPQGKADCHDLLAQRGHCGDVLPLIDNGGACIGKGRGIPVFIQVGEVRCVIAHCGGGEHILSGGGVVRLAFPALEAAQAVLVCLVGGGIAQFAQIVVSVVQRRAPGVEGVKIQGVGILIALAGVAAIAAIALSAAGAVGHIVLQCHLHHQHGAAGALVVGDGIGLNHLVAAGESDGVQIRLHARGQQVVISAACGVGDRAVNDSKHIIVQIRHIGLLGQREGGMQPDALIDRVVFPVGKLLVQIRCHLIVPAVEIGDGGILHGDDLLVLIGAVCLCLVAQAEHGILAHLEGLFDGAQNLFRGLDTEIDVVGHVHNGFGGLQLGLDLGDAGGQIDPAAVFAGAAARCHGDIGAGHGGHLHPLVANVAIEQHSLVLFHLVALVQPGFCIIVLVVVDRRHLERHCGNLHIVHGHLLAVEPVKVILHHSGHRGLMIMYRPLCHGDAAADGVHDFHLFALEQLVEGIIPLALPGGIAVLIFRILAEVGDVIFGIALCVFVDVGPCMGLAVVVRGLQRIAPPVVMTIARIIVAVLLLAAGVHQALPDAELTVLSLVVPLIDPVAVRIRLKLDRAPRIGAADRLVVNVQIDICRTSLAVAVVPLLNKGIYCGHLGSHYALCLLRGHHAVVRAGDGDGLGIVQLERLFRTVREGRIGIGRPDVGRLDRRAVAVVERGCHRLAVLRRNSSLHCPVHAQHHAVIGVFSGIGNRHGKGLVAAGSAGDIPTDVEVIIRILREQCLGHTVGVKINIVLPACAAVGRFGSRSNTDSGRQGCLDLVTDQSEDIVLRRDHIDRHRKVIGVTAIGLALFCLLDTHGMGFHIPERTLDQHCTGSGEPFRIGDENIVSHTAPRKLRACLRILRN